MRPDLILPYFTAAAAVYVLWRLFRVQARTTFPSLAGFLVFIAVSECALALIDRSSAFYFWMYIGSLPAQWIVSTLAVRELISLILRAYPGIRSVGRRILYGSVLLAVTAAFGIARAFWNGSGSSHLYEAIVLHRSVTFTLAMVIILLLLLLSRFPVQLGSNIYISSGFFSAIFLSQALALLLDSFMPRLFIRPVDLAQEGFEALCLAGWALLLKRQTTEEGAQTQAVGAGAYEQELLGQLDALNRILTHAGPR